MTEDDFLDAMKKLGHRVYYCPTCKQRFFGGPVSYHAIMLRDHKMLGEHTEEYQNYLNSVTDPRD